MALSERQSRRLARLAFLPGWSALALVMVVAGAGVAVPVRVRWGLLLGTAVLLGLPHGALDHLTVARAGARPLTARWLARFAGGYLLLAGVYVAAWLVAPGLAMLGFLALTWYHWGQGDVWPLRRLAGADHLRAQWVRRGTTAVRGGVPMVVPLLAFPERYRAVVTTVVGRFGGGPAVWVLFRPPVRVTLGGLLAVLTVVTLARGWQRAADRRGWVVDAAETGGLWLTFAVVPPLVAIAAYFAGWHSVRHLVRLIGIDERSRERIASQSGSAWVPRVLGRTAIDAVPATLGALAVFAGIWTLTSGRSLAAVGGAYLVTLAALTLPHAAVVTWLDRQQGV